MCLFFPTSCSPQTSFKILYVHLSLETRPNIYGFYNTILICDCGFEFLIQSRVLFRESGFCFCCCLCCWGKLLLSRFSAPYPKMQNVCTKHFWAGCANNFLLVFALLKLDIVVPGTPSLCAVCWNVEFCICLK